jgi:hypothetical protein
MVGDGGDLLRRAARMKRGEIRGCAEWNAGILLPPYGWVGLA